MFASFSTVFVAALLAFQVADAAPTGLTNAKRFAAGMGPLSPKRLYNVSKVEVAPRSGTSPHVVPPSFTCPQQPLKGGLHLTEALCCDVHALSGSAPGTIVAANCDLSVSLGGPTAACRRQDDVQLCCEETISLQGVGVHCSLFADIGAILD